MSSWFFERDGQTKGESPTQILEMAPSDSGERRKSEPKEGDRASRESKAKAHPTGMEEQGDRMAHGPERSRLISSEQ